MCLIFRTGDTGNQQKWMATRYVDFRVRLKHPVKSTTQIRKRKWLAGRLNLIKRYIQNKTVLTLKIEKYYGNSKLP